MSSDALVMSAPSLTTCLHLECRCRDEDLAHMRREVLRDPGLLRGGEHHCPPLLHAVIKEHVRCVELLLKHGALVNEEYDRLGESPLSLSVTRSSPDIARLLLSTDASGVNMIRGVTKEPPLVRAVKHGNPDIVKLLLEYGARPDSCTIRNGDEIPVVFLALELGHEKIVKILLEAGASLTAHNHFDKHNLLFRHMQFAISEGQVESLKSLCLYGALHELSKLTLYPNIRANVHYSFPLLCVLFKNSNTLQADLRILDILYEFGFNFWKCDKHDKQVWKKFEKLQVNEFTKLLIYKIRRIRSKPLNLKFLCRIQIQNIMGKNFEKNVTELQIPETLYPFLKYEYV